VPGGSNEPALKPTETAAAAQDTALGAQVACFFGKAASEVLGPCNGVCLGENPTGYKVDNGKHPAPGMGPSFVMVYSIKLESKAQRFDLRLQAARAFTDEFVLADGTVPPLVGFELF
jgi:hypothetical protein